MQRKRISDYEKLKKNIIGWLYEYCYKHTARSLVVGVSGGIDSAVVASLCAEMVTDRYLSSRPSLLLVTMPFGEEDADAFAKSDSFCKDLIPYGTQVDVDDFYYHNIAYHVIDIEKIHKAYCKARLVVHQKDNQFVSFSAADQLSLGNLRARIRANILYHYANVSRGIVVGTGNFDEEMIGYCTKGGDGLVDISPFGQLHKFEVYKLADELEYPIPKEILYAPPTAGLWPGQTDEDELGMTYEEIAWALEEILFTDEEVEERLSISRDLKRMEEIKENVEYLFEHSEHKRRRPPSYVI
jgi:NAD+ synthase